MSRISTTTEVTPKRPERKSDPQFSLPTADPREQFLSGMKHPRSLGLVSATTGSKAKEMTGDSFASKRNQELDNDDLGKLLHAAEDFRSEHPKAVHDNNDRDTVMVMNPLEQLFEAVAGDPDSDFRNFVIQQTKRMKVPIVFPGWSNNPELEMPAIPVLTFSDSVEEDIGREQIARYLYKLASEYDFRMILPESESKGVYWSVGDDGNSPRFSGGHHVAPAGFDVYEHGYDLGVGNFRWEFEPELAEDGKLVPVINNYDNYHGLGEHKLAVVQHILPSIAGIDHQIPVPVFSTYRDYLREGITDVEEVIDRVPPETPPDVEFRLRKQVPWILRDKPSPELNVESSMGRGFDYDRGVGLVVPAKYFAAEKEDGRWNEACDDIQSALIAYANLPVRVENADDTRAIRQRNK